MKRGLKDAIGRATLNALFVTFLDPMKKGTERWQLKNKLGLVNPHFVTFLDPMKKGTERAQTGFSLTPSCTVTFLDPMKRGLKGLRRCGWLLLFELVTFLDPMKKGTESKSFDVVEISLMGLRGYIP